MGISQLFALPLFSGFERISDTYVRHLNAALAEQGAGITVSAPKPGAVETNHDSFVIVELGNLSASPGSGFLNLAPIENKLIAAQRRVEELRQAAALASAKTVTVAPNPTLDHMGHLNPAESAWLERVSGPLAELVNDLYAAQTDLHYEDYRRYMEGGSDLLHPPNLKDEHPRKVPVDSASRWNFARIRTPDQPTLDDQTYNSSIPWFPQRPWTSAMLPDDFTAEETAYLKTRYRPEHPVHFPYTVLERMSPEEASPTPVTKSDGIEKEWHVPGLDGRWYRVTHMRFHERYARFFDPMADLLENNADITVAGTALDPGFRDHTLSVAKALRSGDFLKLLEDDLNQPLGNIFLTIFPHESEWEDRIKNPWELVVGVRDHQITQRLQTNAIRVHQQLQAWTREIAEEFGVSSPIGEPTEPKNVMKMVEVVWAYRTGGYFRSVLDGDVGGHDYPKWKNPRFQGLRKAVILADSEYVRIPVRQGLARNLFGEEMAGLFDFLVRLENTAWHEIAHDFNRPDTIVAGGVTLGTAFGSSLDAFAEPQSDAAIGAAQAVLLDAHVITEKDSEKSFFNFLLRALQMANKSNFLKQLDKGARDFTNNHAFGLTVIVGWLFQNGVLSLEEVEGGTRLKIDGEGLFNKELWKRYIRMGYAGSKDAYFDFAEECIRAIPDQGVKVITAAKLPIPRTIVGRGDVSPFEI